VRKVRIAFLTFLILGALAGLTLFAIGYLKPKATGIYVETTPPASVYINGVQVGRTPYKETRKPGDVVLKLIPDSFEIPLTPYETRINLVSGVETVVRRQFAESEEASGGEVISFEKLTKGNTSLAIVTIPDSAQVDIDGQNKGYAPYKTSTLAAGEHLLTVAASGYLEKEIKVRTYDGYQLTALVKLTPSQEVEGEEQASATEEEEKDEEKTQMVEILSTPVGFLRVREEPSTLSKEVGRVKPGEKYNLLEEDSVSGWFKIALDDENQGQPAQAGWISNQYAKKIEDSGSVTPTKKMTPTQAPTKTPTPTTKEKTSFVR